jgi:hypothetical protein
MSAVSEVTIRRASREDVTPIVAMLADDPLGGARERIEDPLPQSYFTAFEQLARDPNIHLVVAEEGKGAVVGCLQLCILPGAEFAGRLAWPDRGCPRRQTLPQPRHWRADGAVGGCGSAGQGMQTGRTADASHSRRCATILRAAGLCAQPCRHDLAVLIAMALSSEACPARDAGWNPVRVKKTRQNIRRANCG